MSGYKYCTKIIFIAVVIRHCVIMVTIKGINHVNFYGSSGIYSFKDLKVIAQPMKQYKKYNKQRKINVKNTEIGNNKIRSNIRLKKEKLVCIAIPYLQGWKAKLDGKATKIYKVNDMYMGIYAKKGTHKIELCYTTPGLKVGSYLSFFGWLLTLLLFLIGKKSS